MPRPTKAASLVAIAAVFFGISDAHLFAQTAAAQSAVATKTLMQEPLDDTSEPKVSVIRLSVSPGLIAGPHSHAGPVFAYILQGDIENQVEPNPPKIYRAGDFFYEPAMHIHRLLRNLSQTELAQLLIFQVGDTGKASPAVKILMQEPLTDIRNREARVMTVAMAPQAVLRPHKHPGPVFAYILKGEIENQVDPEQPKIYRPGDLFYEPPMHAHRLLRNPSKTEPAELLLFQVGEKGQPLATSAEE
ncbi:MAG: cupin domain-containing protein [Bryobacterales bacterium]|nr:cupin domain-containing protein [Bryobacterales bacterium]MBV9401957.1 cupin domain-containing protein [Bryobacterales bacterium]